MVKKTNLMYLKKKFFTYLKKIYIYVFEKKNGENKIFTLILFFIFFQLLIYFI